MPASMRQCSALPRCCAARQHRPAASRSVREFDVFTTLQAKDARRTCSTKAARSDTGASESATEIRLFSAKRYELDAFEEANKEFGFRLEPLDTPLNASTAVAATRADVVSVFVNDDVSAAVVDELADSGTKVLALRCAGFNNVDLEACERRGITVVRVPAYSPNAIAEHTLALILALNRNIARAYNRVRDRNFSLEGLVGFDLAGKTVGVIGTGRIGKIVARLLWHLRCNVLANDVHEDAHLVSLGVRYVSVDELLEKSQVVTLHCPLLDSTKHLINAKTIKRMQKGVMIVNTGRGPLIDTNALLEGLTSGHVGSVALDVYEQESGLFFEDRSSEILSEAHATFARLLTFPNVLITAHQCVFSRTMGFLTHEALRAIACTTLQNVSDVMAGRECDNVVEP